MFSSATISCLLCFIVYSRYNLSLGRIPIEYGFPRIITCVCVCARARVSVCMGIFSTYAYVAFVGEEKEVGSFPTLMQ